MGKIDEITILASGNVCLVVCNRWAISGLGLDSPFLALITPICSTTLLTVVFMGYVCTMEAS